MGEVQPEGILDDIRKTMHGIQSHNLHLTYACFKDELHSVQQPIHRQYLMYLQERFLSNHLGGDCEQWAESTPRPKLFEQLHLDRIDRASVWLGLSICGNPPKNPPVLKVEISMKEFLHEKEHIHGQPDQGCNKAIWDWDCGAQSLLPGQGVPGDYAGWQLGHA